MPNQDEELRKILLDILQQQVSYCQKVIKNEISNTKETQAEILNLAISAIKQWAMRMVGEGLFKRI